VGLVGLFILTSTRHSNLPRFVVPICFCEFDQEVPLTRRGARAKRAHPEMADGSIGHGLNKLTTGKLWPEEPCKSFLEAPALNNQADWRRAGKHEQAVRPVGGRLPPPQAIGG
jgi:hypothetical protein